MQPAFTYAFAFLQHHKVAADGGGCCCPVAVPGIFVGANTPPHLPTAATRSGRFSRHWRRSHRSPVCGALCAPWRRSACVAHRPLHNRWLCCTCHRQRRATGPDFHWLRRSNLLSYKKEKTTRMSGLSFLELLARFELATSSLPTLLGRFLPCASYRKLLDKTLVCQRLFEFACCSLLWLVVGVLCRFFRVRYGFVPVSGEQIHYLIDFEEGFLMADSTLVASGTHGVVRILVGRRVLLRARVCYKYKTKASV